MDREGRRETERPLVAILLSCLFRGRRRQKLYVTRLWPSHRTTQPAMITCERASQRACRRTESQRKETRESSAATVTGLTAQGRMATPSKSEAEWRCLKSALLHKLTFQSNSNALQKKYGIVDGACIEIALKGKMPCQRINQVGHRCESNQKL